MVSYSQHCLKQCDTNIFCENDNFFENSEENICRIPTVPPGHFIHRGLLATEARLNWISQAHMTLGRRWQLKCPSNWPTLNFILNVLTHIPHVLSLISIHFYISLYIFMDCYISIYNYTFLYAFALEAVHVPLWTALEAVHVPLQ